MDRKRVFEAFGFTEGETIAGVSIAGEWRPGSGGAADIPDPATGDTLARVSLGGADDYEAAVGSSVQTFERWRVLPPPARGDFIRRLGDALRDKREELGGLVSLEVGKILPEGVGEVQEMIDICDFALGLSRQLYGKTMASERPDHRMYEQWHPLGPIGVITAFNFPVAVWSWNSAIAAVCGDPILWKPSERTPLTAIAVTKVANQVMADSGYEGVFNLVAGTGDVVGEAMVNDRRLPLISATGSIRMGKIVGPKVAARLGRSILELGGNNAIVVMDDADLELAVRASLFAAVGTAGQRCTSLRRLLVHRAVSDKLIERLKDAYSQVRIGDPLKEGTLMGPLVNQAAVDQMLAAVELARSQGAEIITGGGVIDRPGYFVEPTIARIPKDAGIIQEETFAPILWIVEFDTLEEAIEIHNGVVQGLSSAIFTQSLKNSERFLSATGSDCGIANVNIGTSGAEIGGAFGGEKDTGGGREAGSDAWKAYMRRQTTTINWGDSLPLAQGIEFG